MSEPGGPSTVNGVLYQLLGSLDHMIVKLRSDDPQNPVPPITLIMEPTGGGGDVRVVRPTSTVIEQWKARSGASAWSLNSLIQEVLPDLFLAVEEAQFDKDVAFVFKTEGRPGRWKQAEAFFQRCQGAVPASDPRKTMDRTKSVAFFPRKTAPCTERKFFDRILRIVSKRVKKLNEPIELRARKLHFLLGRFRLEQCAPPKKFQTDLEIRLRDWVEKTEDAPAKCREACGLLMGLLVDGETHMTADDLRAKIGLVGREFRSLEGWRYLCRTMHARLAERVAKNEGYQRGLEVRPQAASQGRAGLSLLAGESGVGKTWRLAASALASDTTIPVVWVRATGRALETLDAVAWEIWHFGLHRESAFHLDVVAKRIGEHRPNAPAPVATVFIDNVLDWQELDQLCHADWHGWRVQAVITTTPALAAQIEHNLPSVGVARLGDFTRGELKDYLRLRGVDWLAVANDILPTLRRPILARIYCDTFSSAPSRPSNEYELYQTYWRRLFDYAGQVDHPSDADAMRRLAATMLQPGTVYPWTAAERRRIGVSDDTVVRLEKIGWLRRVGDDRVEVWHDRVLNWAAAEYVAERWKNDPAGCDPMLDLLIRHYGGDHSFRPVRRLGYAAADVFWIRLHHAPVPTPADLLPLLLKLEGALTAGGDAGDLYGRVLPTLGTNVVPLLLARLQDPRAPERKPSSRVFALALRTALQAHPDNAGVVWRDLLRATDAELRNIGIAGAADLPSPACLDELANLHWDNLRRWQSDRMQMEALLAYQKTYRALRACACLEPAWLANQVEHATRSDSELADLISLLPRLPLDSATKLWRTRKTAWFARLEVTHRRPLAAAIGYFGDRDEIPRLKAWATHPTTEGFDRECAFAALARLAPSEALACLPTMDRTILRLFSAALREMWRSARGETARTIVDLMKQYPAETRQFAEMFGACPEEFRGEALHCALEQFERDVTAPGTAGEDRFHNVERWTGTLLRLCRHPAALDELAQRADSSLDRALSEYVATQPADASNRFGPRWQPMFSLLARFGGQGLTHALTTWLDAGAPSEAGWFDLVSLLPESSALPALRRLILSTPRSSTEGQQLLTLLALFRDHPPVVQGLMQWGEAAVSESLIQIRFEQGPMTDADIAPAVAALGPTLPNDERSRAITALGLSGRLEQVSVLRGIVLNPAESADVVCSALLALVRLGDRDSLLVPRLRELLKSTDTAPHAALLLIHFAAPESDEALAASVEAREPVANARFSPDVYQHLLKSTAWRRKTLELVWARREKAAYKWHWVGDPLGGLLPEIAELGTPEVEELLWSLVADITPGPHVTGQAAMALRGLMKLNAAEAARAIESRLASDKEDRFFWVEVMGEIDPQRAVAALLRQAPKETSSWVRRCLGLTLRRIAKIDVLLAETRTLLASTNPDEVRAGLEIASWHEDASFAALVAQCLEGARDPEIAAACHAALQRQSARHTGLLLAAALPGVTPIKQWNYAEAWSGITEILRYTRAFRPDDIGRAFGTLDAVLTVRLERELNARLKKEKQEAEHLDRQAAQQ